jgi:hypothetical protein
MLQEGLHGHVIERDRLEPDQYNTVPGVVMETEKLIDLPGDSEERISPLSVAHSIPGTFLPTVSVRYLYV